MKQIQRRFLPVVLTIFLSSLPAQSATRKSQLEKMLSDFDLSEVIEMPDGKVTYGFEAEADPDAASVVGSRGWFGWGEYEINEKKFPYLDSDVDYEEETGNVEFRSNPTSRFDKALRNMKHLRSAIGSDMKAFHMHVRIPKSMWKKIPKADLHGWLARVSDVALGWRLQNREAWYALASATHARLHPDYIYDRGSIRVKSKDMYYEGEKPAKIGDHLDIELRGFMDDVGSIERLMKIVLLGFQNPEMVKGFKKEQIKLLEPKRTLVEAVQAYATKAKKGKLSQDERETLEYWEAEAGNYNDGKPIYDQEFIYDGTSNLPLYGFEKAPYLSASEKETFALANEAFAKRVYNLLQGWDGYDIDEDSVEEFREVIAKWEEDSSFHDTLEKSLIYTPERTAEVEGPSVASRSQTHKSSWELSAASALKGEDSGRARADQKKQPLAASKGQGIEPLIRKLNSRTHPIEGVKEAVTVIAASKDPRSVDLLFRRLRDSDLPTAVRKHIAETLLKNPERFSVAQIDEALSGNQKLPKLKAVRELERALVRDLSRRKGKNIVPVAQKALAHSDPWVSHFGKRALLEHPGEAAAALRQAHKITKTGCDRELKRLTSPE